MGSRQGGVLVGKLCMGLLRGMFGQCRVEPRIRHVWRHRSAHGVQVGTHAQPVHLQTRQHVRHGVHRAVGGHQQAGPFSQFGLPEAQRPFVLLRHGGQQCSHPLRNPHAGGQRHHAGHRVVLVRHGGRAAPPRLGGFGHFSHFKLAHQRQVFGHFPHAADQQAQLTAQRHPLVTLGVPHRRCGTQAQLGGNLLHHVGAQRFHGGVGADRTPDLHAQGPGARALRALKALQAAHQRRRPANALQPKTGDGRRLHQRACQHRVRRMAFSQRVQSSHSMLRVPLDQAHCPLRDQRHGGVHHILAGAGEVGERHRRRVHAANGVFQGLDQRDRHAACPAAVGQQLRHVKGLHAAAAANGLRGGRGDQPHVGLGSAQGSFKLQHGGDKVLRVQHVQHFGRGQKMLKHLVHVADAFAD